MRCGRKTDVGHRHQYGDAPHVSEKTAARALALALELRSVGTWMFIGEDELMEINGVAHTFITAGNFAAARAFYGQLLPFLGLTVVADSVNSFYCVGGRTGFGIHAAAPDFMGQRFRQGSVGLHHHCFRARERGDVDEAYNFLVKIGARIVHEPREDSFAPGYYSVLFEDPDGTRLEINHVPGKGLLAPGMQIGGGYADGTQNG